MLFNIVRSAEVIYKVKTSISKTLCKHIN